MSRIGTLCPCFATMINNRRWPVNEKMIGKKAVAKKSPIFDFLDRNPITNLNRHRTQLGLAISRPPVLELFRYLESAVRLAYQAAPKHVPRN